MLTIRPDAKRFFFDRQAVIEAAGRARAAALARGGAFVRTTARQSMRKRKAPSQPGDPPSSHVASNFGLRKVLFAYDPGARSVVVGPVAFGVAAAPPAMEFGLSFTQTKTKVVTERVGGKGSRGKRHVIKAGQRVTIEPRPFMGPALEANLPKLPDAWKNSIRGG